MHTEYSYMHSCILNQVNLTLGKYEHWIALPPSDTQITHSSLSYSKYFTFYVYNCFKLPGEP